MEIVNEQKNTEWECENCGHLNKGKFCNECGSKKPKDKYCSNCGIKIKSNQKLCENCGEKINLNSIN